MILKNTRHQLGYDLEEFYFEKLNQELIKKIKSENQNLKQESAQKVVHVNFYQKTEQEKSAA